MSLPANDAKTARPFCPGSAPARYGGTNAKMTLTTRLAIAMILLVAIAVSAVGWLSYRSLEQALLPGVLDRIETHSRLVAADLQSYVARRARRRRDVRVPCGGARHDAPPISTAG